MLALLATYIHVYWTGKLGLLHVPGVAAPAARMDDQMESSAAADSALTALRTSRTRMMLCKADGTNKHRRWFWLDKDSATVHWSKSKTGAAVKGKHAHSNVLLTSKCTVWR